MLQVLSCKPRFKLAKYVRAYAQRVARVDVQPIIEGVPARLEQTLEFEFADLFDVHFSRGERLRSPESVIIGLQSSRRGEVHFWVRIESFAIFFRPFALSHLFGLPMWTIKDQAVDAAAVLGGRISRLRDKLAYRSFLERVAIVEDFLLETLSGAPRTHPMGEIADHIFSTNGIAKISEIATAAGLSRRHFERRFQEYVGVPPKLYARIARFQTALDAKVANPTRSWLHIAHQLSYFDQMHMIHDFEQLGGDSPARLLAELGDMRPEALASSPT